MDSNGQNGSKAVIRHLTLLLRPSLSYYALNSVIQLSPQQVKPCRYSGELNVHEGIMLRGQLLVSLPVHPLRFPAVVVQDGRFPAQLFEDAVGSPCRPVIVGFILARIRKVVTMAAKEAYTSIVERGYTINYCRLFDALQCFLLLA
jgi:hypothetical protein